MRSPADSRADGATVATDGRTGLPPLVVIGGATATGKTGLSLALADVLGNAEIVSADSRQVFRGMDIGTAKVSAADRARVPHHGLDLAPPDARFTLADYVGHATEALQGIAARGRVALLVGGTGLYLRAVGRGMRLDPGSADPGVRAAIEDRLAAGGLGPLVAELRERAPRLADATDLANPRRVVRALERATLLGDSPPPPPAGYPAPVVWLGLVMPAEDHRAAIGERARGQFRAGLVEEAAALRTRYDTRAPAFSAFGYREALDVLDGRRTMESALEETVRRTRAFARRQRTWFRSEPGITWIDAGPSAAARAARIIDGALAGA
jgi:tRNA dimethylallyltransferase